MAILYLKTIFIYKRYQNVIILKDKMKYITLFMLVCLFFTVRSEGEVPDDFPNCSPLQEKECKDFEKTESGYNCCYLKAKSAGESINLCMAVEMEKFQEALDFYKDADDVSLDCSGKYLYVASLLLLFFVF